MTQPLPLPAGHARRYFNNAGAALMAQATMDAVVRHLTRETVIGAYGAAAEVTAELADLYQATAELLGCDVDEVALTEGNSRGWGTVVGAMEFNRGDRILVGRAEWGGNYATLLHIARRCGATVETLPNNAFGEVDVEKLGALLDDRVRLISLTWAPSNGGLVQPAAAVGAIARAAGIPYVLDAAQAVGQMPVDVRALGCDVLTAPGRKWLRGPRGTGLLYVRRGFLEPLQPRAFDHFTAPWKDGDLHIRPDARRFECSEQSVALRLGLRVAIRDALAQGLPQIAGQIGALAGRLRTALSALPGVHLQDLGRAQSGLVTFTVEGVEPAEALRQLAAEGFVLSLNGAGFTPLDMQARGLAQVLRAAPHVYNTAEEVDALAAAVGRLSGRTPPPSPSA